MLRRLVDLGRSRVFTRIHMTIKIDY